MPKQNYIMNLIRGLGSDSLKRIAQTGLEIVSPHAGELILRGGKLLSRFAPSLSERFVDQGLDFIHTLNAGPNATVPPPYVSKKSSALFPAGPGMRGHGRGNHELFFGNDQPIPGSEVPPTIIVNRTKSRNLHGSQFLSELPKVEYVPVSGKTSFGMTGPYLGDYNRFISGAPSNASEAGYYFRPVGRGTNVPESMPGFGETDLYDNIADVGGLKELKRDMMLVGPKGGKKVKVPKQFLPETTKPKVVRDLPARKKQMVENPLLLPVEEKKYKKRQIAAKKGVETKKAKRAKKYAKK